MDHAAQLCLIEGIPGSGKTTAAERLCDQYRALGVEARWWLEESKDHPVLPASLRRRSREPSFGRRCIGAYEAFLRDELGVLILEGSAFQNTVRFMFANAAARAEIDLYVQEWASAVASAQPRLMLYRVADPYAHYSGPIARSRGAGWVQKLIAYVERTPIGEARQWRGFEGFVRFWSEYQDLCLDLAVSLPMPVHMAESWSEAAWVDDREALRFFGWPTPTSIDPLAP